MNTRLKNLKKLRREELRILVGVGWSLAPICLISAFTISVAPVKESLSVGATQVPALQAGDVVGLKSTWKVSL